MAHRLLTRQPNRLEGPIRLPLIQRPGEAITTRFQQSLITRDSLRRVKPTGCHNAIGPLPALQEFLLNNVSGPNARPNITASLRIGNAKRVADKTRGQSAGM